jgi:lysylphosphatidylglycerol synthetase-like protein (DUF2156 family)
MAHATLDPALAAFPVGRVGYQAYVRHGNTVIGFFNPVCAPEQRRQVLSAFFAATQAAGIVQVDAHTAGLCRDMSLMTQRMGVESHIGVRQFTLEGASMRMVREARNRGARGGYSVGEIGLEVKDQPETWAALRDISRQWMATRTVKTREVGVLMRHSVFAAEKDCRKFALLDAGGAIKGYQVYDPIYRSGEIQGYTLSFARFAQDGLKGRHYFMTSQVRDRLHGEGHERIELGLSPFYRVAEADPLNSSALLPHLMHLLYQYGGRLYGFKGLALHKRKYRGREQPVYLVSRNRLPVGLLLRLVGVTGLLGWKRSQQTAA